MSGFSFRDARSFECRCGAHYLWERCSGWSTDKYGNMADDPTTETIRDWYRPNSEPVTRCPNCNADLVVLANEARPVK